jgi:hypothetical protein
MLIFARSEAVDGACRHAVHTTLKHGVIEARPARDHRGAFAASDVFCRVKEKIAAPE